jgi:hypothetical protein
MTPKTSSLDFGTISDDKSLTDYELMDKMHKIEEEQKQKEKERDKQIDSEETIRAYRYSHFFCRRSKTVIPKKHEAEIIEHRSTCPYCSKEIEDLKKAKQARVDALAEMRAILSKIEIAKEEIEIQKRRIQRERSQQLDNFEVPIKMAESKIRETEHVIEREQINKHRMLNPDLNNLNNATLTQAVQDMYMQYMKLPSQKKKHFEDYITYQDFMCE